MKKAQEIMTQNPAVCTPNNSVVEAARLMKSQDVGPIPVVENDQTKKLVGIITDRDIAIKVVAGGLDPNSTKITNVMTTNPVTCFPDDDLDDAIQAMEQHQIRRIPIVDRNNRLVGIIAQADIATRLDERKKTGEVVEQISRR